jgi:hypothetical protein
LASGVVTWRGPQAAVARGRALEGYSEAGEGREHLGSPHLPGRTIYAEEFLSYEGLLAW